MSAPHAARSICIITRDLHGHSTLTNAGAATLGLAQHLAAQGETVTIVWVPPITVANSLNVNDQQKIIESLAENHLINLRILTDSPQLSPYLHSAEKASLAVFYYLKGNKFDEVYCTLGGGLAYCTLLAQELGLREGDQPLSLLAHTPTEWLAEADKTLHSDMQTLAILHMERYCFENAGTVILSSLYMRDWISKKGWSSPTNLKVIQPLLPYELRVEDENTAPPLRKTSSIEIGFWPGWEYQNGLVLFCDALDRIAQASEADFTINIFGPLSYILGENTGGLIMRRATKWPFTLKYFPRLSEKQSLAYLKQRNGVAIFPNLVASGGRLFQASIENDINAVATNAGSHSEFVDTKGLRELCDVTSSALAEAITKAVSQPKKRLASAQSRKKNEDAWRFFREGQLANSKVSETKPRKSSVQKKLVSIVIAHYERPNFLADAIKSVEQQDYQNIEVVLVDDGSKKPESLAFLKSLEPKFKERGWKILRQKNQYLGAARNAGIKASSGAYVLFLDDDNALLNHAVTTFVKALETSGSDICTSVSKIFLGPHLPKNPDDGLIEYFPLGGSLDCAFVFNSFGDANAIIRRDVFAKIGYLVEDYGFIASDWEFFTRAALHDLKIRIIPEATYWYRSSAEGMFRSSHWVESRLPILRLFEKHKFKGLSHIYQLLISQNTDDSERKGYHFRLRYDLSNARHEGLNHFEPDSDAALEWLAGTAAAEGRADTALNLLGQLRTNDFATKIQQNLLVASSDQTSSIEEPLAPAQVEIFDMEKLKGFSVASSDVAADSPLSFIEKDGQIVFQSEPNAMVVATLTAALPAGSLTLSFDVALYEELSSPIEILAGLVSSVPTSSSPESSQAGQDILASSDWVQLQPDFRSRKITLSLKSPSKAPVTLAICIRHSETKKPVRKTLVSFIGLSRTGYMGLGQPRRPRIGILPTRQFARALTNEELCSAVLGTAYGGKEKLLEFPTNEKGFLLRPCKEGVVVAVLPWAFPAFAKGVVASVEVAQEDVSPFEFSISLARPSELGEWTFDGPTKSLAFSGWKRVERKFELHELALELDEARRYGLTICAAIRLPAGSAVEPARSFFRKIVLTW